MNTLPIPAAIPVPRRDPQPTDNPELGYVHLFDPKRIKPDPNNPRKRFRRIAELAESIRTVGQTSPGKVTLLEGDPDFDAMLVDGERRLRACMLIEKPFEAYIDQKVFTPANRLIHALAANFNQQSHDQVEVAYALQDILDKSKAEGNPLTHEDLGNIFGGMSSCWVSQHLSILRLHENVQQMLIPYDEESEDQEAQDFAKHGADVPKRRKHLPFSVGLLLLPFPHDQQLEFARKILEDDMSLVKARRFIMKKGSANAVIPRRYTKSPTGASESFGNKIMDTEDRLGIYIDMPFAELERLFSTTGVTELDGYLKILDEIAENTKGLADSLRKIFKRKVVDAVNNIQKKSN